MKAADAWERTIYWKQSMENWKDIPGYEGRYQVSDLGRVRSVDRRVRTVSRFGTETTRAVKGRALAPQKHSGGYQQVGLCGDLRLVHWLVLMTFVGPRPTGLDGAHNDGNKENNAATNLSWKTPRANAQDRILHGTSGRGTKNIRAKLSEEEVLAVRAATCSQEETARRFGVRQGTVSKIVLRQRWGHL